MITLIIGALCFYIAYKLITALVRYLLDRKNGGSDTSCMS